MPNTATIRRLSCDQHIRQRSHLGRSPIDDVGAFEIDPKIVGLRGQRAGCHGLFLSLPRSPREFGLAIGQPFYWHTTLPCSFNFCSAAEKTHQQHERHENALKIYKESQGLFPGEGEIDRCKIRRIGADRENMVWCAQSCRRRLNMCKRMFEIPQELGRSCRFLGNIPVGITGSPTPGLALARKTALLAEASPQFRPRRSAFCIRRARRRAAAGR